ncbi:site-specific integrase [Bacillus sp. R86525]|uniref:site-specific integrase n=1 Tax=Bacillus sp. R86525 TaxID=3101709 RepID=UPI00367096EC
MRKGEILGLQWKEIDFERRTLSVNRSLSHITKEFHEPKTSSGKRLLVLPDITLMALQEHLQKTSEEKERYGEGYNDYDLVCPTYNGNPCDFRSLTQLWKKLIKKSEIPDIRFHDLRHTRVTIMLKQSIHPKLGFLYAAFDKQEVVCPNCGAKRRIAKRGTFFDCGTCKKRTLVEWSE